MKIINWIKEEMKKDPFLNEYLFNLKRIEVEMGGNVLFEDGHLANVNYYFDTPIGERVYDEVIGFVQLLHEVRSEGFKIYAYETNEFYVEYDQIIKILLPIEEEVDQKLLDYYIDHVHDYSTGELKNFTIKIEE